MKEIKAIIQPFMLSKVINALKEHGNLPGVTVSDVRGFGKTQVKELPNTVTEDSIGYAMKVKLEIVVSDEMIEEVVEIINKNAHTGNIGDGKIFVYTVDEVVKIRTGETGEGAI